MAKRGGNPESAQMAFDQHMGDMYPFSLAQKLAFITEQHPYYTVGTDFMGRPIIPLEMISVLVQYTVVVGLVRKVLL